MTHAGSMFTAYGTMNLRFHVFLATGLTAGDAALEVEEQDLITRPFALTEVEAMIKKGEIGDSITVATLGLLRMKSLL